MAEKEEVKVEEVTLIEKEPNLPEEVKTSGIGIGYTAHNEEGVVTGLGREKEEESK